MIFAYFGTKIDSMHFEMKSSCGGLEVERMLHRLHDSISVGSNPDRRLKDFCSNSNTTGGGLIDKVEYIISI